MIVSHLDIIYVVSDYVELPSPSEASWTFESYVSMDKDDFKLTAWAKDSNQSRIVITPQTIMKPDLP